MMGGESRRARFEAGERAALDPLPEYPWKWGEWIARKVAPNCHVRIDRNHYSSLVRYVGQNVDASRGERMVEEFPERGRERIAVYPRQTRRNRSWVRQSPVAGLRDAWLRFTCSGPGSYADVCRACAPAVPPFREAP